MARILYLVPAFDDAPRRGQMLRYAQIVDALRDLGHAVTVKASATPATGGPAAPDSRRLRPIRFAAEASWCAAAAAVLRQRPDLVIASHPHFTDIVGLSRRLHIPVVVEAHNYEPSPRMKRALGRSLAAQLGLIAGEAVYLPRAARVWTLSENDRHSYARTYPGCSVRVVPHAVLLPAMWASARASPPEILFVGAFSYGPNEEAALFLAEQVMPVLRDRLPGRVHLRLVGAEPPAALRRLRGADIEVTGAVDDLAEHYARATAVVCPVESGGGLKTKVIEAMAHGCPVVATPRSLRGIEATPGKELVVAPARAAEFADAVADLIRRPEVGARIGAAARRVAEERYSPGALRDALRQELAELLGESSGPAVRNEVAPTVAIIDPPLSAPGQARPWNGFAFSDIALPYARAAAAEPDLRVTLVGSYDVPPEVTGADVLTIPAARRHLRNPGTQYVLYRRCAVRVRALRPAIIHSPDYFSLAVIAGRVPRAIPVITTPGSILERRATVNPYDPWFTRTLQWATDSLRRRNAWVLATSLYMARWWARSGFDPGRIRILPLPTDLPPFAGDRAAARVSLGWGAGATHLLSAADLRAEMQLPAALRLFAGLAREDACCHLHLLGAGAMAEPLAALAADLGLADRVSFHGRVPYHRLAAYYTAADALLVSRRYNATPRAAQEALICGTPVIANLNESLCGFAPGIDRAVMQVDFEGPEALSAVKDALVACRRLAAGPEAIAGAARAVFGADVVGARLIDLYREIAGIAPAAVPARPAVPVPALKVRA